MSCWRLLELSDTQQHVPQLLIKSEVGKRNYTVFLTDLSNIWSEKLDIAEIVERASEEESPIEVSKQDTTQLSILLENIRKSLVSADDTVCRITRDAADGITLHATIALPDPLGSLGWKFHLQKRTSVTLKNELILPLLVSSHIQHERINSLVTSISEKDRAIARLLDQFESSNLDLASAFPSISGSNSGRRVIRRDQAAKLVPGLEPFHEVKWRDATSQFKLKKTSTLGLFQEALSQSVPNVPPQMRQEDEEEPWWTAVSSQLDSPQVPWKTKLKSKPTSSSVEAKTDPLDEETDDEFETHEHFKQRESPHRQAARTLEKPLASPRTKRVDTEEDEATEDTDLDAPPKSQGQPRTFSRKAQVKDAPPKQESSHSFLQNASVAQKPKGFRIGGAKTKISVEKSPPSPLKDGDLPAESVTTVEDVHRDSIPSNTKTGTATTTTASMKTVRKPFKIGGKQKESAECNVAAKGTVSPSRAPRSRDVSIPDKVQSAEPVTREASDNAMPGDDAGNAAGEKHEETPEEKAERKRRELKRKNEELSKKQAQKKQKRRF
ncbi:XLF-domain-containing protein [Zopfia rhizophila CBS 207.26]|uniref:Non-homologous end-joining factor 1 n=1 Tax=Zopfia rhizophila CBS 207.26 TaxID=1314779 RepID=A0A6A6E7K2_9PEZI|nr:XLF-domain-containing protein [Zopfia rhizophila CBS 207.26]